MLAAIVIIILLLSWGAYTCFGKATPTPTPTPTPIPTAPPIPVPTALVVTPTPPPTPLPIYQSNLGDWVTAPPLLMLASSVERTKVFSVPAPMEPPTGSTFVIVSVTVTNGGSINFPMTSTVFHLVTASGFSFPAQQLPFTMYNQFPFIQVLLGPGSTVGGRIVFVVPDVVKDLRLQILTTSGFIQWIIPN
jgi:hypothetical protein